MIRTRLNIFGKKTLLAATVVAAFATALPYDIAYAAGCSSAARRVASQQGGKVLSASDLGNKCRVVVLVPSKKGPPRKKTVTIRK